MKRTDGPWTAMQDECDDEWYIVAADDGVGEVRVAEHISQPGCDDGRGDAMLMAAAPDLHAVVTELLRIDNNLYGPTKDDAMEDLCTKAKAALAKARGETT